MSLSDCHPNTFGLCENKITSLNIILGSWRKPTNICWYFWHSIDQKPSPTFRLLLLCWCVVRRFGAFCRCTRLRKSSLTACWDIRSWNWSKSWQRLDRLRVLWFNWNTKTNTGSSLTSSNFYNKVSEQQGVKRSPLSARHGLDTSICRQVELWVEGLDSPCGTGGDNNHTGSVGPTCNSCVRKYRGPS